MQGRTEEVLRADAGDTISDTHILQTQLKEYAAGGLYPFHMPGHKRRVQPAPGLAFEWDVTEVPGMDDLHDASGILREAMERTAKQCGADRTWYLVNGSTCGLLAGIRALAQQGSDVICARNCHKAVYHALELSGCRVHWIMPEILPGWGICGGISAVQVADALKKNPSAKAVILTSPTYEGILSDIAGICRVCHARKIPVLVDEAHGAHLMPASEQAGFPAGALSCGADVAVQSPHKTLPSLTQTALLHLQGSLADPERIEEELDIFETSSPSYLLMASLDGCTGILRARGQELFEAWTDRIARFDRAVSVLRKIRILCHTPVPGDRCADLPDGTAGLYDPGKILIDAGPVGMTGPELAAVLREKWKMETEMTRENLVLVMTSICDDEDALDRLAAALLDIEECAGTSAGSSAKAGEGRDSSGAPGQAMDLQNALESLRPHAVCSLVQAHAQEREPVPIEEAAGRISARYLYFYPPGIPFLAPGELITPAILNLIRKAGKSGRTIYRGGDGASILCLRE